MFMVYSAKKSSVVYQSLKKSGNSGLTIASVFKGRQCVSSVSSDRQNLFWVYLFHSSSKHNSVSISLISLHSYSCRILLTTIHFFDTLINCILLCVSLISPLLLLVFNVHTRQPHKMVAWKSCEFQIGMCSSNFRFF
jgi:hypothetical protein